MHLLYEAKYKTCDVASQIACKARGIDGDHSQTAIKIHEWEFIVIKNNYLVIVSRQCYGYYCPDHIAAKPAVLRRLAWCGSTSIGHQPPLCVLG